MLRPALLAMFVLWSVGALAQAVPTVPGAEPLAEGSVAGASDSTADSGSDSAGAPLLAGVFAEASRRPVRVLVYGASHTASDEYTRGLRLKLQRRYGDGGLGWFLPASPFPYYEHAQVEFDAEGWSGIKVRYDERTVDDYGLAGFAVQSEGRATSQVRFLRGVQGHGLFVSYLQQPRGGTLTLNVAGEEHVISTRGRRQTRMVRVLEAMPNTSELAVSAQGAVRLFGLSIEAPSGVTVDAFGVPGARAADQLPWRTRSLRQALIDRPADLVVLAYGTNESARRGSPQDRARLRQVVRRFAQFAPAAARLLVGPGEWPRVRRGRLLARPRTAEVIADQRAVARLERCDYFDVYTWMGGEGSMGRWVEQGLGERDYVHFTPQGYAQLAAALFAHVVGEH